MKSAPILGDAQAAAEAEVARQGFPAEVLARNNVHFGEGAAGLALADAIAWAWWPGGAQPGRERVGRIGSWIFQPLLLVRRRPGRVAPGVYRSVPRVRPQKLGRRHGRWRQT
jgi:hypothetical protein